MPLIIPQAPAEVMAAFNDGLPMFLAGNNRRKGSDLVGQGHIGDPPAIPSLGDVTPGPGPSPDPNAGLIHTPQEVFVLNLDAGGKFAAPVPAGWRAFAGTQQFSTVIARVTRRPPYNTWKMTACYYANPAQNLDQVWAAYQAIIELSRLQQVQSASYELRVLAVPMLNLETFWLAPTTPGEVDLIVPFLVAANQRLPILDGVAYAMDEFLAKMFTPAQRLRVTPDYSGM